MSYAQPNEHLPSDVRAHLPRRGKTLNQHELSLFADLVRAKFDASGLSQSRAAYKSQMAVQTFSNILLGRQSSRMSAERVAKAFDIKHDLREILAGTEERYEIEDIHGEIWILTRGDRLPI